MNEEKLFELLSHPLVLTKKAEWMLGDIFICNKHGRGVVNSLGASCCNKAIWIPQTFDIFNPKRGMWEWVDWSKTGHKELLGNSLYIHIPHNMSPHGRGRAFLDNQPIALLKTFLWQNGVDL